MSRAEEVGAEERAILEWLEPRLLLSGAFHVVSVDPAANSHDAPPETLVSATCNRNIDPASASDQTFVIHAAQTGTLLGPDNVILVGGATIALHPSAPFHAGELVQGTVTAGLESLGGQFAADPFVWQFRVEATDGTGFFVDSGQLPGGGLTTEVALGDLDGDGDLDAFATNDGAPDVVWLNDGLGHFSDTGQRLGSSYSRGVDLGDLDGDGDLDAFVVNSQSQPDRVWLNDGQGTFTGSGQGLGNSWGSDVCLGDLDGDGDLDAFVANEYPANRIWLNDGAGWFTDSAQGPGMWDCFDAALGDLDGDGDLDAFTANGPTQGNEVWLNNGRGYFSNSAQWLGGSNSRGVDLGDLDGDGDLDAFVANWGGQGNKVWQNNGAGYFIDSGQLIGCYDSAGVSLGDVDSDGDLDAFVADYAQLNKVWLNNGLGCFSDGGQNLGNSPSVGVALGDVDGNGALDAFVANYGAASRVWSNQAPLAVARLEPPADSHTAPLDTDVSITYTAEIDPFSVPGAFHFHADQTGKLLAPPGLIQTDGATVTLIPAGPLKPGEVVQVTATKGVRDTNGWIPWRSCVYQFRAAPTAGEGAFVDSGQALGGSNSTGVSLGDVDGDGDADALIANNSGSNTLWLNDGTGGFHAAGSAGAFAYDVALADLDGDGHLDAFLAKGGANEVWRNRGDGSFANTFQLLGSSSSSDVALGDLDADGDLDAFVTSDSAPNEVWLNNGMGGFSDSAQRLGGQSSQGVALGDLDGDGDLDAFVANVGAGWQPEAANKVWLNDGEGGFTDSGQLLGSADSAAVSLGDLDGDGDLDAFVANGFWEEEPNRVWINHGQGLFSDSGQPLGNADSRGVSLGDLDADGDLDAFVANASGAPNRVWLNDACGGFSDNGQGLGSSFSMAVAAGDLDGDGALDAFVGNFWEADKVWLNCHLPGLVGVSPAPNSHTAELATEVSATYDVDIDPLSAAGAFVVHGGQTGTLLAPPNTISVAGPTVTLEQAGALHPGELVHVTATAGIRASGSQLPTQPFVWQFRTEALGGSGTFNDSLQRLGGSQSRRVSLGDLDGDGDLDAFTANGWWAQQANRVWLNDASGAFTDSGQALGGSDTRTVALGDLDGDGDLDAFAANSDGPDKVWLNDGTGLFTDSGQELGEAMSTDASLGDLDADGDLDVFVTAGWQNVIWLNDGEAGFSSITLHTDHVYSQGVALGDLDGDGDLDAFTANHAEQPNEVWLNGGQGDFVSSGQLLGDSYSNDAALGDLDGDGDLDAFVANENGPDKVWLNDGSGVFSDTGQGLGDFASFDVSLGDLDADGDLDAFVVTFGSRDRVWLNDGHGAFIENAQNLGGSPSLGVCLGDLDGDGDLDAFVASGAGRGSQVWLNELAQPGPISGCVFHDLEGNGQWDEGDPPLEGWKIYLDINVSGGWDEGEPFALTNANGEYVIGDVIWETYLVAEVPQDAWVQTYPAENHVVLVTSGPLTGIDFANYCLPGDADHSGRVDFRDYLAWKSRAGTESGAEWGDGDFDLDQDVDHDDFGLLRASFGRSIEDFEPPAPGSTEQAAPVQAEERQPPADAMAAAAAIGVLLADGPRRETPASASPAPPAPPAAHATLDVEPVQPASRLDAIATVPLGTAPIEVTHQTPAAAVDADLPDVLALSKLLPPAV
jgi:hypothetical protein